MSFFAMRWLPVSLLVLSLALPTSAAPLLDPDLRTALERALETPDSFADRYDAEVWLLPRLMRMRTFIEDPDEAMTLLIKVHREALRAGLDPDLVLAVIEVESRFDRFAISRAGAQGLMQVMAFWKSELGRADDNLMDAATNLRYGCAVLAHYLTRESGNLTTALARYNGSYGHIWYSERVFSALQYWR